LPGITEVIIERGIMNDQEREDLMPAVSVIIPTYNRANFITEAVDSILIQDYSDVEIVVIDDGSDDDTKVMLRPYENKIRYFYQENKGLGEARNKGIKEAHGKYIALLDSDDLWLPGKLQLQIACMEAKPEIGLCCTNFHQFNDEGVIQGRDQESWEAYQRYGLTLNTIFLNEEPLVNVVGPELCHDGNGTFLFGNIFTEYLLGPLLLSSTAVLKRSLALDVIPCMNGFSYTHDYYLFAYISKTHPVGFINLPLCKKRSDIKEKMGQAAQLTAEKHQIGLRMEYLRLTERLWRDDQLFFKDHKKQVNHRLSLIHSDLGYRYFRNKMSKKALSHFVESIRLKPYQKRVYPYLFFSALRSLF